MTREGSACYDTCSQGRGKKDISGVVERDNKKNLFAENGI